MDDPIITKVCIAGQKDPEYQAARREIEEDGLHHEFRCQGYFSIRDSLSTDGDFLLYGSQKVVPSSLRGVMVRCLHSSHQ